MSLEKSELKVLIANNLGAEIEDQYDESVRLAYGLEEAAKIIKQAAKSLVVQLCKAVEEDIASGTISDQLPALKVAELVKKYIIRSGMLLDNIADTKKQLSIARHGEATGLKIAMGVVSRSCDKELEKIKAVQEHVAAGSPPVRGDARPSGVRPGPSISSVRKEQAVIEASGSLAERRAAAKAQKAAAVEKSKKPTKKAKLTRKRTKATKKPAVKPVAKPTLVGITPAKAETLRKREAAKRQAG